MKTYENPVFIVGTWHTSFYQDRKQKYFKMVGDIFEKLIDAQIYCEEQNLKHEKEDGTKPFVVEIMEYVDEVENSYNYLEGT